MDYRFIMQRTNGSSMGCILHPVLFKRLSNEIHKKSGFLVSLKISEGLATQGHHSHVVTVGAEHQVLLCKAKCVLWSTTGLTWST